MEKLLFYIYNFVPYKQIMKQMSTIPSENTEMYQQISVTKLCEQTQSKVRNVNLNV